MKTNFLVSFFLLFFPWTIRRRVLNKLFGYKIHSNAKIGFSIIAPKQLEMGTGAYIGHLNMCKGLDLLKINEYGIIENLNWITGMPMSKPFFRHQKKRNPSLVIKKHAAITSRHFIDCTDKITIGQFTTIAGYRSQLLTHSIDLTESKQDCAPISIGKYCFVGTGCVILPGSSIGNYCVLGGLSLLNKNYQDEYILYGGVPAIKIKELEYKNKYFQRLIGFVN